MEFIKLFPEQEEAVRKLRSGSVLKGGVGSGKTLTSLFFYKEKFSHRKLYVITTAKKRNSCDWQNEARLLGIEEQHITLQISVQCVLYI